MAPNTLKCNHLTPLGLKGLILSVASRNVVADYVSLLGCLSNHFL